MLVYLLMLWPTMKPMAAPIAMPTRMRLYWHGSLQQLPPFFSHGQSEQLHEGPHVHFLPLAQPQPPAAFSAH